MSFEELTFKDIKAAIEDEINPATGEYDEEMGAVRDTFLDGFEGYDDSPIGRFEALADWSGGDGHQMGRVSKHVPTGIIVMALGTYSSWDASDWDVLVEAEPYTFTETRYQIKD